MVLLIKKKCCPFPQVLFTMLVQSGAVDHWGILLERICQKLSGLVDIFSYLWNVIHYSRSFWFSASKEFLGASLVMMDWERPICL